MKRSDEKQLLQTWGIREFPKNFSIGNFSTEIEEKIKIIEMKKIILCASIFLITSKSNAQLSIYDQFEKLDAAYLPDENTTYFVENIEVSTNEENEDHIKMIGVQAKMKGNYIDVIVNSNPNLKPVVKKEKHREPFEDHTGDVNFACIKSGLVCVIILKKNQHLGGF